MPSGKCEGWLGCCVDAVTTAALPYKVSFVAKTSGTSAWMVNISSCIVSYDSLVLVMMLFHCFNSASVWLKPYYFPVKAQNIYLWSEWPEKQIQCHLTISSLCHSKTSSSPVLQTPVLASAVAPRGQGGQANADVFLTLLILCHSGDGPKAMIMEMFHVPHMFCFDGPCLGTIKQKC